jgi:hypothetical protein
MRQIKGTPPEGQCESNWICPGKPGGTMRIALGLPGEPETLGFKTPDLKPQILRLLTLRLWTLWTL